MCLCGRLSLSASNVVRFAGNPRGVGGSEVNDGGGNVIGLADATKDGLVAKGPEEINQSLRMNGVGFGRARVEGVNADPACAEFLGEGARQAIDR